MTEYNNSQYPEKRQYNYDDSYNYEPTPKKKKKGSGGVIAIVCVVALVCAMGGSFITGFLIVPNLVNDALSKYTQSNTEAQNAAGTINLPATSNGDGSMEQTAYNPVVDVAEKVSGSVVGVTTIQRELVSGQKPAETPVSSGTGFAIDENGHILTNAHVIEGGNYFKITTSDGTEHEASLVGTDSDTEIAILKVEGLNLTPVEVGNSDELKAGELVVAIGNPLGQKLANSVTVGYVSSVSRDITLENFKMDMIQTDAAINPGNSGGPLVNSSGQVIGINTMKNIYAGFDTNTGSTISSEGIGFAVPINKGIEIAKLLIENGAIVKPGIGIKYSAISQEDATLWEVPRGALIGEVTPQSPAAKAGIKVEDILTEFDGIDLTTGESIPSLSDRNIGDVITGKVYRGGSYYSFEMTIEDLNQLQQQQELTPVAPSIFG